MCSIENITSMIRLREEYSLLSFMEGRINSPLIQKLLYSKDTPVADELLIKGYSPLKESLPDDAYGFCCRVQSSLNLADCKIEYLTSNHPKIKAASFFNADYSDDNPHVIILNPDLFNILNEQELAFVIGHEIGHLMFEHDHFKRVIQFIYPGLKKLPYLLRNLYELWSQLAEISADRVGLSAVKEIEPAIMAMCKCSNGRRRKYHKSSYADLVAAADNILMEMAATSFQPFETHPANPFRIKALKLFFESKTRVNLLKGRPLKKDKDLDAGMDELVSLLKRSPGCDIDKAELEFLASAGYLLIASDRDIGKEEVDHLKNLLSQYFYMPRGFIDKLPTQDLYVTMRKSSQYILANYPERTRELFMSLLPLVMRDGKIHNVEVELGLKIAVEDLKIDHGQAVDLVLCAVRDQYAPFS